MYNGYIVELEVNLMTKINEVKEQKKKVNKIYNQFIMVAIAACALATPFIVANKSTQITKQQTQAPAKLAAASPTIALENDEKTQETEETQTEIAPAIDTDQPVDNSQEPTPIKLAEIKKPEIKKPEIVKQEITQEPETTKPTKSINHNYPRVVAIHESKIDTKFILKMEGMVLKGYVPLPEKTKSGVTIAGGLDIGQLSVKEFNKLPMSADLRAKLLPYVGLKRFEAKAFLKAHPLHVTRDEAEQLNLIAANMILMPLSEKYHKASGKSFSNLPPAAQTALFSFAYQYGAGFMTKQGLKKLWNHFVAEEWSEVSKTLNSFKMYSERRKQEARLLAQLM